MFGLLFAICFWGGILAFLVGMFVYVWNQGEHMAVIFTAVGFLIGTVSALLKHWYAVKRYEREKRGRYLL